jgi:hypothetical protein
MIDIALMLGLLLILIGIVLLLPGIGIGTFIPVIGDFFDIPISGILILGGFFLILASGFAYLISQWWWLIPVFFGVWFIFLFLKIVVPKMLRRWKK